MSLNAIHVNLQDGIEELQRRFANLSITKRFSDRDLEMIYTLAHGLFTQGKYERVIKIFMMLCIYRPLNTRYMIALALCQKQLEMYEHAMMTFDNALALEPRNLTLALHIVECLLAMEQEKPAMKVLRLVVDATKSDKEQEPVHQRAMSLLALLRKH